MLLLFRLVETMHSLERVPDSLFDDKSKVVMVVEVCQDSGIGPSSLLLAKLMSLKGADRSPSVPVKPLPDMCKVTRDDIDHTHSGMLPCIGFLLMRTEKIARSQDGNSTSHADAPLSASSTSTDRFDAAHTEDGIVPEKQFS